MKNQIVEEFMVPTDDSDISIYLRNKRRPDTLLGKPDRTLLFVHGATYPSSVTFDFVAGGYSWMDTLADAGFDCWLMDIRGYGRSDRPAEMSEPADANGPIVHTDVAVDDLALMVDFILAKRNIEKLQLIGYSWGTLITGAFTSMNNEKVERLALYGTSMLNSGASLIGSERPTSAYRYVDANSIKARWEHGLTAAEIDDIIEPDWQQRWLDEAITSDPNSANHDPPLLRAPTGVVDDKVCRWSQGVFQYDPAEVKVPTLIIVGEKDIETSPEGAITLYHKLVNTPHRRYTIVGNMTHSALIERRRDQLFRATQSFLEEDFQKSK
ncbi:alpha/beta hydrolase [Sneathiella marina]|uniref:Alpha/beta hydrolase n=1 Tax=Sneathiella marina TaxID=2950108 RepID=A0ABY4W4I7_9PROT|nr:alpha/beta fold hydrolase [Sneathiella marina]USG61953.1 alpha/beta hydrolase [Sneathiella marina]